MAIVSADKNFDAQFSTIVKRWYANEGLSQADRTYLLATPVSVNEFLELIEQNNIKHGVELINSIAI
jgi:hypothetical protein